MSENGSNKLGVLVRCPPYCPFNCTIKHHPLLVALLNCGDTEDKAVMQQRLEDLQHVVTKYEKEKKWKIDLPIPEMIENYRYPLLHWACAMGRVAALIWLLGHGANAKLIEPLEQATGLHRALECLQQTCPKDSAAKFRQMLPVMEDSLLLLNQEGNSPLHVACQMLVNQMPKQDFYQQCMENILEYGKRRRKVLKKVLKLQNVRGNTVLHILSEHDSQVGLVKEILNLEMELLDEVNFLKETPLEIALSRGQMLMSCLLNQKTTRQTATQKTIAEAEQLPQSPGTEKRRGRRKFASQFYKSDSDHSAPVSDQESDSQSAENRIPSITAVSHLPATTAEHIVGGDAAIQENNNQKEKEMSTPGKSPSHTNQITYTPVTLPETSTPSRIIIVGNSAGCTPTTVSKSTSSTITSVKKKILTPPSGQVLRKNIAHINSSDITCISTSPASDILPQNNVGTVKRTAHEANLTVADDDIEKRIKTEEISSEIHSTEDNVSAGNRNLNNDQNRKESPRTSITKAVNVTSSPTSSSGQEGASFMKYLKVCDPIIREKMHKSIQQDKVKCDAKLSDIVRAQTEIDERLGDLATKQKEAASSIKNLLETLTRLQVEEESLKQEMSQMQDKKDATTQNLAGMKERVFHCQAALDVLQSLL